MTYRGDLDTEGSSESFLDTRAIATMLQIGQGLFPIPRGIGIGIGDLDT